MPVLVALIAHGGASKDAPPPLPSPPSGGSSRDGSAREIVSAALVALCDAETTTADDKNASLLLKQLNLDVLMHTRSDDARVRLFALQCARALWTAHGGKLIGAC